MDNPMLAVMLAMVICGAVLTLFPYLEGQLQDVGQKMADAGNYTVDTTKADQVKSDLWGIGGPVLILGMIGTLYFSFQRPHQNYGG